jgi:hypothetical protein
VEVFEVANTLAYKKTATIATVKSFIIQAPATGTGREKVAEKFYMFYCKLLSPKPRERLGM